MAYSPARAEYMRGYRLSHPEYVAKMAEYQRVREKTTRRRWPETLKYNHHGMTPDDYWALFKIQRGVCAICRQPARTGRLQVDHDHATGLVRGLLCRGCNLVLGHGAENPSTLRRAAHYLTKRREVKTDAPSPQLRLLTLGGSELANNDVTGPDADGSSVNTIPQFGGPPPLPVTGRDDQPKLGMGTADPAVHGGG